MPNNRKGRFFDILPVGLLSKRNTFIRSAKGFLNIVRCEFCGNKIEQGQRYCPRCNRRVAADGKEEPQWYFCPECGCKNRAGRSVCARCGAPVQQDRRRSQAGNASGRKQRRLNRRIWAITSVVLFVAVVCIAAVLLLGNRNPAAAAKDALAEAPQATAESTLTENPQATAESTAEPAFESVAEVTALPAGFADDTDLQRIREDSASALAGAALCIITDCSTDGEQRYITIDYVSFYNDTDPQSQVGVVRCRNDSAQTSTFPVGSDAVFSMAVTDLSDESWYENITYDMELNNYFKQVDWDTIASCYQTQTSWGGPSYFWVTLDGNGSVDCIWQEIDFYYAD